MTESDSSNDRYRKNWEAAFGSVSNQSPDNTSGPIRPEQATEIEHDFTQRQPEIIPHMPPSPPNPPSPAAASQDSTPQWKKNLERGAFLVALGLLIVNIFQACSTKTAAEAARSAAETAKGSADSSTQQMWAAIRNLNWAAQSMDYSSKQAQRGVDTSNENAGRSLTASERQSTKALDTTVANARLDQRAWLGIHEARLDRLQENTPLGISIQFLNTGKTPALHVTQGTNFRVTAQFFQGPQPDWVMNFVDEPQQSVAPEGPLNVRITLQPTVFNFDLIRNGRQWAYWYGRLRYADISGTIQGRTDFCVYVSVDAVRNPDIFFCNGFNNLQ